jgi:hypothetical protein
MGVVRTWSTTLELFCFIIVSYLVEVSIGRDIAAVENGQHLVISQFTRCACGIYDCRLFGTTVISSGETLGFATLRYRGKNAIA